MASSEIPTDRVPFVLPSISVSDGWGPTAVPAQFAQAPYASFSRSDRLGRAADFGGYMRFQYKGRYGRGDDKNADLDYKFDETEAREFSLVDSKVVRKPQGYRPNNQRRPGGPRRDGAGPGVGGAGTRGYDDRGALAGGRGGRNREDRGTGGGINKHLQRLRQRNQQNARAGGGGSGSGAVRRETSVKIGVDWIPLETFNLHELGKLATGLPTATDLKWAGTLEAYDEEFDKVTAKTARKLRRFDEKDVAFVKTQDDAVMQQFAQDDIGNVFATDMVLSHLMAASRSVFPWDVVVTVLPGGAIFLDVRDALEFSLHTVNETAPAPPPEQDSEDINGHPQLAIEATAIHHNFTQQILSVNNRTGASVDAERKPLAGEPVLEANPLLAPEDLEEGHATADVAYRYRKFELAGGISLVARTTLHAVARRTGVPKYIAAYSLHEWDPRKSGVPDYRKLLDSQRGNLLATEIKNNAAKLAKFTISSMLAGAHSMKLGFVSRGSRADSSTHQVLGVGSFPPEAFAAQLALSEKNMWGIIRWIVELVRKHAKNLQEDVPDEEYIAKFLLLRDANKAALMLYSVPLDAFDSADGEGGGGGGGGADGEAWGDASGTPLAGGAAGAASGGAAGRSD